MDSKIFLSGGMNIIDWQSLVIKNVGKSNVVFFNPREHELLSPIEYTLWDCKRIILQVMV